MKRITHKLYCGAVYSFNEYRIRDFIPEDYIIEKLGKDKLSKFIDPYTTGRKFKPIAGRLGSLIIRLFFKKVIDRLMNSDILDIGYGRRLYIGRIRENPKMIAKKRKRVNPLLLTMGKRYGVVMDGFSHNYYFRMPFRRRKELYERIKSGQSFN